jgi:hypothetical protein
MTNLKYCVFTIFLFLFAIGLITGCKQYAKPVVHNLFPHPPDTTNMLYLSNFTSKDIRKSVINEEIFLEDSIVRKKGLAAVPQDYDDFRSVDLDEVYWKGEQVIGGDFRGTSFRSAKCSGGVFIDSDFRFCDIRWWLLFLGCLLMMPYLRIPISGEQTCLEWLAIVRIFGIVISQTL